MASKKTYSFRFFGKRGGFVSASRLRSVAKYSVVYGGRTVVKAKEFPSFLKKVADRRDFLRELVESIERKRLQLLEKRREQYRKRKEAQGRAQLVQKVSRRLKKSVKLDRLQSFVIDDWNSSKFQLPVFEKTEPLDPEIVRRGKKVYDALEIPVRPDGKRYVKKIIDKTMISYGEMYHLSIMDLTLDPEARIEMSGENFYESYKQATRLLLGSVLDYYEQTRKSSELYILRIKFLNRWDESSDWEDHGISWVRTQLTEPGQVLNLFRKTFLQLFGPENVYDLTTSKRLRTSYLGGDRSIIITGLSLEATTIDRKSTDRKISS